MASFTPPPALGGVRLAAPTFAAARMCSAKSGRTTAEPPTSFGGKLTLRPRAFFCGSYASWSKLMSSCVRCSRPVEPGFGIGRPAAPSVQAVLSPALSEIFICIGTNLILSWLFHKIATTRPQPVYGTSGLFASPLQTLIIGGCFLKAVSGIHPINLERMLSRRLFHPRDRHVAQAILFGYLLVQLASLRHIIKRAPPRSLIEISDSESVPPTPSAEDDGESPLVSPSPSPPETPLDGGSPSASDASPSPSSTSPAALAEKFPRIVNHPAGSLIMATRSWRDVWWTFFAACVVTPVFEEWVYRGIVFRRLVVLSTPVFAALATAVIFGVSHCLYPFFAARDVVRRAPAIRKDMLRQQQSARTRLAILRAAAAGDWGSAVEAVVEAWGRTGGRPAWPFQPLSKGEVKQLEVCEYPEDVEDLQQCEGVVGRLVFRWYEANGPGKPHEAPLHAILGTRRAERVVRCLRREIGEWDEAVEELDAQIAAQAKHATLPRLAVDSLSLAPMGAALSAAYVAAGGHLRASIACHALLNALAAVAALVLSGKLVFRR